MRRNQRLVCAASAAVVAAGVATSAASGEILCLDQLDVSAEAFEWLDDKATGVSATGTPEVNAFGLQAVALADRGSSFSQARAFANHGYLDVRGVNNGLYSDNGAASSNGQALASASFLDTGVTVEQNGYDTMATGGAFTAWFRIDRGVTLNVSDGSLGPGLAELAGGMNIFVTIGGANTQPHGLPYGGTWFRPGVGQSLVEPNVADDGLIGVEVAYTYGVPFTIAASATLNLISTVEDGENVPVDADFGSRPAFQWMGVSGLEGLEEGVTISSECNDDWTQPVLPEPSGAVALSIGALVIGRRRR